MLASSFLATPMSRQIFVNLPVKDLQKTKTFFSKLGFTFNERFTDENAACMIVSDTIYSMLMTHESWRRFMKTPIVDGRTSNEVLLAIKVESIDEVNRIADLALQHGGEKAREPEDYGFMFVRSIHDPDGHVWEFFYMDESKLPPK